jgi:hypothetical protein
MTVSRSRWVIELLLGEILLQLSERDKDDQ